MSHAARLTYGLVTGALLLVAGTTSAFAVGALETARTLAAQKHYDRALAVLQAAEATAPKDGTVVLAEARILGWKGDYAAAEARLASLGPRYAADPDAQVLRASWAYYQGNLNRAAELYAAVLQSYPGYDAAAAGLKRVQAAQAARARALKGQWIVTAGTSTSQFRNPARTAWQRQDLIVARKLQGTHTVIHLKAQRYDRFSTVNHEYEFGLDTQLSPEWQLHARAGYSPEADYRPHYRMRVGLERKIGARPWFVGGDLARDIYRDSATTTLRMSLATSIVPGWMVRGHLVAVDPGSGASMAFGRDISVTGQLTPNLYLAAGYANTPDTENGVTINNRSYYVGAVYDLTAATAFRLTYTREERPNSYVRREVNAALTIRF